MNIRYLLDHKKFFLGPFSTHYPFEEAEIYKYKYKIRWGSCTYSFRDENYSHAYYASPGLIFNKHIHWTEEPKEVADFECNHLAATWEDYYDLPLEKSEEMGKHSHNLTYVHEHEIKNGIYDGVLYMNLLDKTFQRDFTNTHKEIIIECVEKVILDVGYAKALTFNESLYRRVLEIISDNNSTFTVLSFFDVVNNEV